MFHERARTLQAILLILDAVAITAAFGVAMVLRIFHDSLPFLGAIPSTPWVSERSVRSEYAILVVVHVVVWLFFLWRSRLYVRQEEQRLERIALTYLKAMLSSILVAAGVVFALKIIVSRLLFAYFYVLMLLFLVAKQSVVGLLIRRIRTSVAHRRHALVIGAGQPGTWFAEVIRQARGSGYDLVGLLVPRGAVSPSPEEVPVLGTVDDLDQALTDHPVDEVFIIGSAGEIAELAPVAQRLIEKGRVVSLVSSLMSGGNGVRGRVTQFSGIPMISFGPMPNDELNSGMKRLVDVTLSAAVLLCLSPLFLVIGLLIKITDRGPVLFRHRRLGLGGKPFVLFKFRSMRADAEAVLRADPELYRRYVEGGYKLPERHDPRITPLGRFLRKSSLDELPQIWNVLKGEMTLVGPRPIVPEEIERYAPYESLFLAVRPGLTGHWQVSGRSEISYPDRAFLDLDYVGSHSLLNDLSIILRTVPAVLRRRGAH